MSETCSYCGEKGHSIQNCPKWKGEQSSNTITPLEAVFISEHLDRLNRFEVEVNEDDFTKLWVESGGSSVSAAHAWVKFRGYNHSIVKLWGYLDTVSRGILLKVINSFRGEVATATEHSSPAKRVFVVPTAALTLGLPRSAEFTEPVLGRCHYEGFYITNQFYGGYSAKCEHGSISADYHNPLDVVNLAKKADMSVHLAGDAWKEVGRKGWGEVVSPDEAEKLLKELARKRGLAIPERRG